MTVKPFVKSYRFGTLFTLHGKASRSEYWLKTTLYAAVPLGPHIVYECCEDRLYAAVCGCVYAAAAAVCIVLLVCVNTRRLHDIGRSGWWQLMPLASIAAAGFTGAALVLGPGHLVLSAMGAALIPAFVYVYWMCKR